jgi:RNA polymerase sigma-70 factor, ECF subfamily
MMEDPQLLLTEARAGNADTLGRLLELYRHYLSLLARMQIGQRLQGKVDESDLVQETFLEAHRNFGRFRGTSEAQFIQWLSRTES